MAVEKLFNKTQQRFDIFYVGLQHSCRTV